MAKNRHEIVEKKCRPSGNPYHHCYQLWCAG